MASFDERIEPELDLEPGTFANDDVVVRELRADDLDRLVTIDKHATGVDRRGYYEKRLQTALQESGVRVSLAAEIDGSLVGFVIGRVYHGEYGRTDTFATIDSIGVDPAYRGRGVGTAMMEQLVRNLRGLRVERIQTEVDWDQWDLLRFLHDAGFQPAPRLALEMEL